jgi:hypothetical protein
MQESVLVYMFLVYFSEQCRCASALLLYASSLLLLVSARLASSDPAHDILSAYLGRRFTKSLAFSVLDKKSFSSAANLIRRYLSNLLSLILFCSLPGA